MNEQRHNLYKDILLEISHKIDKDDLQRMKFKCDQVIKKKQNQKIAQPTDLFTALEERGYLSEMYIGYLKDLLKTCCSGKIDGLHILESYERGNIPGFVPSVHECAPVPQQSGQPQIVYVVQNGSMPSGAQSVIKNRPRYEGPDLTREISFLCQCLGRDWKFLIRALGIAEDEIETILCDYRTVRERIHQCLLSWQHQEQQRASRGKLINALRQSSVQRNDLALKLEEGSY